VAAGRISRVSKAVTCSNHDFLCFMHEGVLWKRLCVASASPCIARFSKTVDFTSAQKLEDIVRNQGFIKDIVGISPVKLT